MMRQRQGALFAVAIGIALSGCSSSGGASADGGASTSSSGGGSSGGDGALPDGVGEMPAADAGPAPTHFGTLPIHATLPTEGQCTAWVNASPTPEGLPANDAANHVTPSADWLMALHAIPTSDCSPGAVVCSDYNNVTGAFTGSTDMILRWAACKWGIDEDVVRAEAWEETNWQQSHTGDSDNMCQSINVPMTALNYWTEPNPCQPSKGILQVRVKYWNAWPYAIRSTSLNADYRMAAQRSCMNGDVAWLVGTGAGTAQGAYPPGDTDTALYGCMGHWFSGSWGDSGSDGYIASLKMILATKPWPH